MRFRETQPGVFYPQEDVVTAGPAELDRLVEAAGQQPRKRARLCAHRSVDDLLHDMIICHRHGAYIRPHKHYRPQSLQVISGRCDILLFDDGGEPLDLLSMSSPAEGATFFVRLSQPKYYSLIVHSDALIIHEAIQGPFAPGEQVLAPWSPEEDNPEEGLPFLQRHVDAWHKRSQHQALSKNSKMGDRV